jgi:hypothetical protein
MINLRAVLALSALATLAGCTTYYEVTDPTTDKVYYSTKIDQGREGSVSLTDAGSGANVTIQNSEVKEVSKDVYKANAFAAESEAAPAPAAEPEAAPAPAAEAEADPAQ